MMLSIFSYAFGHMHIFFGEMSIQILCLFLVIYLFINEL